MDFRCFLQLFVDLHWLPLNFIYFYMIFAGFYIISVNFHRFSFLCFHMDCENSVKMSPFAWKCRQHFEICVTNASESILLRENAVKMHTFVWKCCRNSEFCREKCPKLWLLFGKVVKMFTFARKSCPNCDFCVEK